MPGDLYLQVAGLSLTAVGVITGILVPITRMLATHRKSFSDKMENFHTTLNKRVEELTHTMADHELDDERRFSQVSTEIDSAGDIIRREFGETAAAIREHTHKVEIENERRRLEIEQKFSEIQHMLYGRIDHQAAILNERTDSVAERVRLLEVGSRRH